MTVINNVSSGSKVGALFVYANKQVIEFTNRTKTHPAIVRTIWMGIHFTPLLHAIFISKNHFLIKEYFLRGRILSVQTLVEHIIFFCGKKVTPEYSIVSFSVK